MSECNSIENSNLTYYQRNRDVKLNRAKKYYENNKERLREQAKDKYRNLSGKGKKKKKTMGRCRSMSEDEKKRLKQYQKNCREAKKSQYIIIECFF